MTTWVYVVVALAVVATIIFHKRLLALFAKGGETDNTGRWVAHHNLQGVSKEALPVYSPEREKRHAKMIADYCSKGWGNNIPKGETMEQVFDRVNGVNPDSARRVRASDSQRTKS